MEAVPQEAAGPAALAEASAAVPKAVPPSAVPAGVALAAAGLEALAAVPGAAASADGADLTASARLICVRRGDGSNIKPFIPRRTILRGICL